jgi:hypothetical protein
MCVIYSIIANCISNGSRDIAVGIATGYGLYDTGVGVRVLAG